MAKKYLKAPYDFATSGNYPAGGHLWSGQPRTLMPSPTADGFTPDIPIAAEQANALEQVHADAHRIQAHAALSAWAHVAVLPGNSTDHIAQAVLPAYLIAGGFIPALQPYGIVVVGTKASNSHAYTAFSSDGRDFASIAGTIAFDSGFAAFSHIASDGFSAVFGGTSAGFKASVDGGANWTAFTVTGAGGAGQASHYSGSKYLIAISGTMYSCASLTGTWVGNTFGAALDSAIEIAHKPSGNVVVLRNINATSHKAASYSTDGGVTWTTSQDFGNHTASLVYSVYWGLFVVISDACEMWTSPDGATWSKVYSVIGGLAGITRGAGDCAAVGSAIALTVKREGAFPYAHGIAYSLDLGATWSEIYFGDQWSTTPITKLTSANGRIYACDEFRVFVSGALESPDTLYTGTP